MGKQSQHPFKGRHFQSDIILVCVRWYLRYSLSYRDLARDTGGTGIARGSYHDLPLGAALCSRVGTALSPSFERDQQLVASR
jgi:hypothetical protein